VNDGVDGAPNGISVPRWSLSKPHLKGSRPWASLAVTRVGLDLAKRVFQVHAVDAKGEIVVARRLTRNQLIPFFAALPPCVVAMEACSSAHHWGRAPIALGHEVRLLPSAHVKPFVRRNKNDPVDAAAICEASARPGQQFVRVRSIENQAALMRHRAREQLAGQRVRRRLTQRSPEEAAAFAGCGRGPAHTRTRQIHSTLSIKRPCGVVVSAHASRPTAYRASTSRSPLFA